MATRKERRHQRWQCPKCSRVYDGRKTAIKGPFAVSHRCPQTMQAQAFIRV